MELDQISHSGESVSPFRKEELLARLETLSFEESFQELEKVVVSLEGGELSLEQSLSLYEQGKILAQHCSNLLEQAELRVKLLSNEQLLPFKDTE